MAEKLVQLEQPTVARPNQPMPQVIAKAVLAAIEAIKAAEATGKGEDADTSRQFRYASINDVLEAGHETLIQVGLTALPVEVEYSDEVVTTPTGGLQILARYSFRFRLVHKDGHSWLDEQDTRHISLLLPIDGKGAGKAQSLAVRDYYKGLLRIRTVEPDDENQQQNAVEKQKKRGRETSRIPPKNGILFAFGQEMESLTPEQVEDRFKESVADLKFSQRKQWEAANATGLRELHERATPVWLRIRKELERE